MAEEHRCQAPPEGPRLCANNCGFFGSPATLGLCSKCYRDHRLKEEEEASAKIAVEKALLASSPEAAAAAAAQQSPCASSSAAVESCSTTAVVTPVAAATAAPAVQRGRCTACRKRVGLTGFKCRCGETFCMSHRYPEQHGCTFDFKSAGREVLARANPVVKADKLDKI